VPTTYSIVGLGKLGACMAAAIASRGHGVVGVDLRAEAVTAINEGRAPVNETGLGELIAANRDRLSATTSVRDAVHRSDVTFVVVPTPSDAAGGFSVAHAVTAFDEIGVALRDKARYHLVVLASTVLPGSTRAHLLPALESRSAKRCGGDFGLCYSPEFIALGTVVRDFLNPDFTLIGEFDDRSGALLEACYAEIVMNAAPCRRMSIENAELTKIALNSFVTTKITFANMIAELCERIPGGDVDVVTRALGLDRRIGSAYLTGSLGYGGPCFPRDNEALASFADSVGVDASLPRATDNRNRHVASGLMGRLGIAIGPSTTVALLGMAYKPGTAVLEESQSIHLARSLAGHGARVLAHDPMAGPESARQLDGLARLESLETCLKEADIIVLATPDPAYRAMDPELFDRSEKPVTVVDCWRLLAGRLEGRPRVRYVALGRGASAPLT
jgi:UDPglucose 6-dehydrogenase